MAIQQLQQFSCRSVVRYRIACGTEAVDAVFAISIGDEAAAEVHVYLFRVLLLVESVGGGVPDVELGAGDGEPCAGGNDAAGEVGMFRFGAGRREVMDYGAVHGEDGGVGTPEWAEDCGGSGA